MLHVHHFYDMRISEINVLSAILFCFVVFYLLLNHLYRIYDKESNNTVLSDCTCKDKVSMNKYESYVTNASNMH